MLQYPCISNEILRSEYVVVYIKMKLKLKMQLRLLIIDLCRNCYSFLFPGDNAKAWIITSDGFRLGPKVFPQHESEVLNKHILQY